MTTHQHDPDFPDVDPATGDEAETVDPLRLSDAAVDRLRSDVHDALADAATDLADAFATDPFSVTLHATEAAAEALQEQIDEWVHARKVGNAKVIRQRGELARLQSALRAMRKAADVVADDDV